MRIEGQLENSFRDLERRKERLLAGLAQWPPETLAFKPGPQAWSALQVLDHVCRSEQGIFEAMRSVKEVRPVPAMDRLRSICLNTLFLLPVRVRAPGSVTQIVPAAAPALPELTHDWAEIRRAMEEWLRWLTAADCRGGRFYHPVAGWMSVPTALGFLRVHLRHHVYQLDRIRRAAPLNPPRSR